MNIEETRQRIEALLEELRELDSMSAESRATVELDQQSMGRLSRMDAMQRQAIAQATGRSRSHEIARLEAALARIDAGTYGECLRCGEEIDARRLEVDPAATLCIDCASGD